MRGSNSNMLQHTVEMAASSSKMLQIARTRTGQVKSPRLRLDRGSATTAAAVISEGKVYAEPRWNHLVMVNTSKSSSLRDNQESTATSSQIWITCRITSRLPGLQESQVNKDLIAFLGRWVGWTSINSQLFLREGPKGNTGDLTQFEKAGEWDAGIISW